MKGKFFIFRLRGETKRSWSSLAHHFEGKNEFAVAYY